MRSIAAHYWSKLSLGSRLSTVSDKIQNKSNFLILNGHISTATEDSFFVPHTEVEVLDYQTAINW